MLRVAVFVAQELQYHAPSRVVASADEGFGNSQYDLVFIEVVSIIGNAYEPDDRG